MSNSKNSFRIDDILSGSKSRLEPLKPTSEHNVGPVKKRALSIFESKNMPYQATNIIETQMELQQSELQRALLTLFNHSEQTQNMNTFLLNLFKTPQPGQAQAQEVEQPQQHQQPQQQHHMNPEAYLNEYYMRLFASRHATSSQDFGSGNTEDYPVPSAKRFKSAPVDQQQQFQSLLLNKYLPTSSAGQNHPQKHLQQTSKRLSSEEIPHHHNHHFNQKQALSNSALSSSSTSSDVLNTSPRSLLSNSDESASSSSSSNSAENVSPLDALLHLANSTFTSHLQHGHSQRHDTEASQQQQQQQQQQALILNNIYKLKKHGMHVNDENNGLLGNESGRTSHNTSFDSSVNGSSNNNNNYYQHQSKPASHLNSSTVSASAAAKRKRKNRTAFTANQIFELEKRFSNQRYLSPHDRDRIAYELSLSTSQVITWFQNRRAKQKRDIEELKNDVTAAKSLKVIGTDIDVSKVYGSSGASSNKGDESNQGYGSDNDYLDSEDEQEVNFSTNSSGSNNELNK